MIQFNEYGEIIRPDECETWKLSLGHGAIQKAKTYDDDVTKLLVYIQELELELQKLAFLKEKADEVYKYIATIKKIQNLTINILPVSMPGG